MWQDYVMAGASMGFAVGLVPQIIHGFKNKMTTIQPLTASITSLGLYAYVVTTLSLDLYFSAGVNSVNSLLWTNLLYQSIKYKNKSLEDNLLETK